MTWKDKKHRTVLQQLDYQRKSLRNALYYLFNTKLGGERCIYQFSINNSELYSAGAFGAKTLEGVASVVHRLEKLQANKSSMSLYEFLGGSRW
ncbi:hypothetical protein KC887_04660 [Candidatus Kaiserbacteria bacterium]|nr:hypothetical protein [Candidatus Kaiserbacteria bacterium]